MKPDEVTRRAALLGMSDLPRSKLRVSAHAAQRALERFQTVGFELKTAGEGRAFLLRRLAESTVRVERVLDAGRGKCPTQLHHLTDPDVVAVVRGDTVVTLLTEEMYRQNKAAGVFLDPKAPEAAPPLTHRIEDTMPVTNDPNAVRQWARDYWKDNPNASVHTVLKAATNARIAPVKGIFEEVRLELREKLAPAAPVVTVKPVISPMKEVTAMPEPTPAAPVAPVEAEAASIRFIARQLLDAMRAHGMESCILTVTDRSDGPSAEWEVEYRRRTTGKASL